MPPPTISWNADADGDWATAADWTPDRLPTSADDVAIDTIDPHTVTHGRGTDSVHTLTVANDRFLVRGGTLTINSTASFADLLSVANGTLALGGAATVASFSQDGGTVSGAGILTVTGPASFPNISGASAVQTGSGTTVLQGVSTIARSLTLKSGRILENQGTLTLDGAPLGGELQISRGALINDVGATIDLESMDIGDYFTDYNASHFINAGTLEKTGGLSRATVYVAFTSAGAIDIASGSLWFRGPTASFSGTISGGGTLSFLGGKQALESGAIVTVSNWSIRDGFSGPSQTSINENLTYAGVFSLGYGVITVATGDTLTLTGAATLTETAGSGAGSVIGAGTVQLSSARLGRGFTVGGTVTLSDVGAINQTGPVTIADAATLSIAVGAVYKIDNDSRIARGTSFAETIRNSGLLIKSGGVGTSGIGVTTYNNGSIEAASGTLAFHRPVRGRGTMTVDSGATLRVAACAATLGMTFNGGGATLALGNPATFAATINGFAPTDTIDLLGRTATAATLNGADQLVIANGTTTIATLQLAGDYSADTFNVASDGHGGTNITVTTGAVVAPPPAHQFIAAMAGTGAGGGAQLAGGVHTEAFRSVLTAPRLAQIA